MSKISELHLTLLGLLSTQTSDLRNILDGETSYSDLTTGEKSNATQRKKDNSQALALLDTIKSENRKATDAEKEILAKYTGAGGLGLEGSEDEYYTPNYIASGAWAMFGELDEDAEILEPSAGLGIFAQTMPEDINLKQIELSHKSSELNSAITEVDMLHGSFENRSYDFKDNSLDGVITNVPFAEIGSDGLSDKSPQFKGIRRIEHYFILRSMELLKYGKRAVFIVPTGILDNKSNKLQGYKKKILQMGSFIGGVRLPNKIFSHTGADVAVDILVFEKHREDAYKALQGGLVQYDSRESVIFDNEVNRSFIFGNYFDKPLGKKNMIGTKISSKEFSESRFLGQTKFPKSAVLTEDDMDTLKIKVAKIFKQAKFGNTTSYNDLILLNNVTILDKLSLTALSEMDKTRAFFEMVDLKISEGESLTVDNLKEFKRRYEQFAKIAPAGKVVKTFKGVNLYLPLMAINYTSKGGVDKTTKKMADALIFTHQSPARIETPDLEKKYKSQHALLKIISDKAYASQFKEKMNFEDKGRVNHQIASILGNATVKLLSNWDMATNEKPEILEFKKFQTLHDILALKGKSNTLNGNGGYDYVSFTKDEILDVDDLFLSHNGDIIPMGQIAYDGANYGTTMDYITSLEYSTGDYGLSEDEFDTKINSMKALLSSKKSTVNINSLKLDHKAILSIASADDADLIRGLEEDIINDMDLMYIKADNITDPNKDTIDFPTSLGIVQFYAKGYDDNFKKLWDKYEDEIKTALGVSDYREAIGRVNMAHTKVFEGGMKQYYMGESVFNKIKPIILKEIRKRRQEFDIKLETEVKLNPVITAKIKAKLERDSTLKAGGESDHERLNYLSGYIHESIIDRNHGYQNEDIRHFSTSMKGTIAQDTGLGKTATIFMSAVSTVITNRAKRSMVVVPTAVYDKWVMEIKDGKQDKDGKTIVDPMLTSKGLDMVSFTTSATAQKDWASFSKDSTKRIIVMPHSVFETFKFTTETQKWVIGTSKQEEREGVEGEDAIPSMIPDFTGRDYDHMVKAPSRTIGFFEDGDIEYLVIDEGQMAKNSSSGGSSAKFASSIMSSRYGVCVRVAQVLISKKHGMTGQGVVIATATPFTSSPYEIYTMLKNTGGMTGISNMKDFEDTFMEIEQRDEVMATDPDKTTQVKVFEGLKNIQLLNSMGLSQIKYRNAETESQRDVNTGLEEGSLKPEYEEFQFNTEETEDILDTRTALLGRYELFKEYKKQHEAGEIDDSIVEQIEADYGYNVKDNPQHRTEVMRKGSVFSLVHAMNMLSMNKRIALDGIMEFDVSNMEQDKLEALKEKLLKQDVTYPDIEVKVDKNGEESEKIINVKVKLSEYIRMRGLKLENDGILSIPEVSENITKLVIEANKDNADLFDIDEYPKYKLLLENITKELNENTKAKQLVFSISIVGARIIEHFVSHLYKDLKLSHKIMNAVNVGKAKKQKGDKKENDDLGALAQFQEDYNNSTISTVLIFTTKNSTGVDFNKMTKAVHLVDIPYTPDVWHQAMGRGVRQGNKIGKVNVYQYSTSGTLDVLKLRILSEKGDWQEKLKNSDDLNSITSIQSDGEKIIQQALSENKNATVEDIDRIINAKKSERESIILEERKQRTDAIKQSVNNASELKELLASEDAVQFMKHIRVVDEIKTQERSVDIMESNGTNVAKNIRTNSYDAIQYYLSDKVTDDKEFIKSLKESSNPQELIHDKLNTIEFKSEEISSYSHKYLSKILETIERDNTEEIYRLRGAYSTRIESDKEIIEEAKKSGIHVEKISMLSDKQYTASKNIIDNNINRAKADIEAKLLSIIMADSIMNDAVSQALEFIEDDEKELYKGLANGTSIFAYIGRGDTKELVKIEDTINLYQKKRYERYIELPNNKMLSASYTLEVSEKTSEYKFYRAVTKTNPEASQLEAYYEKLEKQKGQLEAHKSTIEKYFNTDPQNPALNMETLKGIRSLKEYLQIVELIRDLKNFSTFDLWFENLTSPQLRGTLGNIKDEIVMTQGETIASVSGVLLSTGRYARFSMNKDIKDGIAVDKAYQAYGEYSYVKAEDINTYNYTLLKKISSKKEDELKGFIQAHSQEFKIQNGVVFPKYPFVEDLETYLINKDTVEVIKESIKDTTPDEALNKSIDTLRVYFQNASELDRFEFIQSVVDGAVPTLAGLSRIIKEIQSGDKNKLTEKTKYDKGETELFLTDNLDLILKNAKVQRKLKSGSIWNNIGVNFFGEKAPSIEAYNLRGDKKTITVGWKIDHDSTIMEQI